MTDSPMMPYMHRRWRAVSRQLAYGAEDRTQHHRWRRTTLQKLQELTGYATMQTCPLRPRITETVKRDGYTRQRIEIQTEPGVVMPMYALIPHVGRPPYPVMLAPHGHGSGGKVSPAGCLDQPGIAAAVRTYNYNYGAQFVRAGFITFCPDARGFGERREPETLDHLASSCQQLSNMGMPLGQTVTGMWAWDLHRLIDYAETRRDCDTKRLGCAGLSGGGLQTLWVSAFDSRIRCAIVSGYFYGYEDSLLILHNNCACNYVPRLYEHVDIGDVGALIAPRALLIETGDDDPLNGPRGLRNVKPQVAITRKAYRNFGEADRLKHVIFEGDHRWEGEHSIPWLRRWLDAPAEA